MAEKNLGDIAAVNEKYYSSKGKAIYSDFSTFAQGRALAICNAIEFVRDFSNASGAVIVCEYGIGKGDFAKTFLSEVQARAPELYARTRYHLLDISEKMIEDARKNLAAHGKICEFHKFDAAQELPALPFHYCRINELFCDLPAEIYARSGNSVPTSNVVVQAFLSRIDDGRQIPFSFAAEKFLLALCGCGNAGFRVDIFDYGFYTADDIFSMPVEEWNRLVVRKYGGKSLQEYAGIGTGRAAQEFKSEMQTTVDVNFLQLSSALAAQGILSQVEPQKSYCERVLGVPLTFNDEGGKLDYVKKKEKDGIEEDDGFYHLSIRG